MTNIKLPLFYQPNQVILLDDNKNFLNNLMLVLPLEFYSKCFTSPETCVAYLNEHFSTMTPPPSRNIYVMKDEDEPTMELNLAAVHQQIYNKDRFKQIAVCVTDHTMPKMNGVEFCEAIANLPCQKILLTGDAGHELAVRAFNHGLIQKFILKDSIDYTNSVIDAISEQRLNCFINDSQALLSGVLDANPEQLKFLNNAEIKHYFDQACNTKGIVEYYILDDHGSYLMLDMYANPTWFLMKDSAELNELASFAELNGGPADIINKIRSGSHIPFFFSDADFDTDVNDWGPYLQPVIKTVKTEDTTYFISIVPSEETPYKFEKPIYSYEQFLEEE